MENIINFPKKDRYQICEELFGSKGYCCWINEEGDIEAYSGTMDASEIAFILAHTESMLRKLFDGEL